MAKKEQSRLLGQSSRNESHLIDWLKATKRDLDHSQLVGDMWASILSKIRQLVTSCNVHDSA